jgi:hypothetical protein
MITVTDGAREYLHGAASGLAENECFRLARSVGGKIALVTGLPVDSDVTFEHEKTTVLAVEAELAEDLKGRTVDIEEKEEGKKGLVLV